jgi:hypothetical protein
VAWGRGRPRGVGLAALAPVCPGGLVMGALATGALAAGAMATGLAEPLALGGSMMALVVALAALVVLAMVVVLVLVATRGASVVATRGASVVAARVASVVAASALAVAATATATATVTTLAGVVGVVAGPSGIGSRRSLHPSRISPFRGTQRVCLAHSPFMFIHAYCNPARTNRCWNALLCLCPWLGLRTRTLTQTSTSSLRGESKAASPRIIH